MIVKPKVAAAPSDPRLAAGERAEQQMAFYLHRAFAADESVLVLNDLRLADSTQPEYNGVDGACQIDHLVLHRFGAFIVESKSVADEISIRKDGTGGDEWRRVYGRREQGMDSPIRQVERQAKFLRAFLHPHTERLLEKKPPIIRTISKLFTGSAYWSFDAMPIQIIIAVSGSGIINRVRGWKEPSDPFQCFVCKADEVTNKIASELDRHRSIFGDSSDNPNYGAWWITQQALARTCAFLFDSHAPRDRSDASQVVSTVPAPVASTASAAPRTTSAPVPIPPAPRPASAPNVSRITPQAAVCKHCGGSDLVANWGQYGYYWKCACGKNTPVPTICHNCNTEGHRGQTVRIRKEGPKFFRCCDSCGVQQLIWTNQ